MQKIINSKTYELHDQVFIIDPYSKQEIYTEAWLVNPGFTLAAGEYVFDAYYSEYKHNQKQLYFLHIPRTSGMSVKYSLMKSFSNYPIYSNFIQHTDDDRMSGSRFISGHFARYPIELAKQNKQNLLSYTVLRDPIDRYISQFLYTLTLSESHAHLSKKIKDQLYSGLILDKPSLFIDALEGYSENPLHDNMHCKHLTHTINKELVDTQIFDFKNDNLSENMLHQFFMQGKDLKIVDGISPKQGLDSIDLVDIVGINSNKLRPFIYDNFNIDIGAEQNNINSSFIQSKEFIKKLPTDLINKIVDSNKDDYELYEYALTRRD